MKRKKGKSYFTTILVPFLLLSLVIILLSSLLYFRKTMTVIHSAFAERNLSSISQVSHMFDLLHSQLIPGLKEASYNNVTISRLMFGDDISKREMLDGLDYLDDLLLSYPLINSLYIYNGQMDYFITTSNGVEPAKGFFDHAVLQVVHSFDKEQIDQYWPRTATLKTPYTTTLSEKPVLTLLMGTVPDDKVPLKGALISNIDVGELQNLLNTRYGNPHDEIFIINHKGRLICRNRVSSSLDSSLLFERAAERKEERGVLDAFDDRLVTFQFNYRLGWYFFSVMPLEQINREILDVSHTIMLIMSSVLLASLFFSYFATRRIYRPIDSLMSLLSGEEASHESLPRREQPRELSFLVNRYKSILREKEGLELSLEDLQDDYHLEIFRSILEGHEYHYWEEELSSEDWAFINEPFSLFLVQWDNAYQIAEEMKLSVYRTLRSSLIRMVKEELDESAQVIVEMDERNLACLFSGAPETSLPLFDRLRERIREELNCSVTVSWVSRKSREEMWIKEMYPRALAAAGGKFLDGYGARIAYTNQDKSTRIFPGDWADRLFQHMRQGDLPGALNRFEEIALSMKEGTYQDFLQHIRIFSYRILRYLKDRDLPEIQKLLQRLRSYPETLETLQNFRVVFRDILETILKQSGKPGRKGMQHFRMIEETLKREYSDPACCVQSLADTLGFSPNYLRQIYKSFAGRSLSDEIVRLRIEEACRLLRETDEPVKQLYEKAGFTNYSSFFTCFKRNKGKTPADYRRTGEEHA